MSNYRTVRVYPGTKHEYDGLFLGFGITCERVDEEQVMQVTSAIVQNEHGAVDNFHLYDIKFLD